jgi:hypothetical protein
MRTLPAVVAMAMTLVSGCCGYRLPPTEEFSRLPLRDQMAAYDQAWRRDCVMEQSTVLLLVISDHGYEAADAMTSSLKGSGAAFPPEEAVTVLEFVHFGGADLRQHEAFLVLQELARTAPNPALRKRARLAVARIAKDDPLVKDE